MDEFRKVPGNVPRQEELAQYLHMPLTKVPDPYDAAELWARETTVSRHSSTSSALVMNSAAQRKCIKVALLMPRCSNCWNATKTLWP